MGCLAPIDFHALLSSGVSPAMQLRKILLIGGGVANFTDVASTFKGLAPCQESISDFSLSQVKEVMKSQKESYSILEPLTGWICVDRSFLHPGLQCNYSTA